MKNQKTTNKMKNLNNFKNLIEENTNFYSTAGEGGNVLFISETYENAEVGVWIDPVFEGENVVGLEFHATNPNTQNIAGQQAYLAANGGDFWKMQAEFLAPLVNETFTTMEEVYNAFNQL